MQESLKYLSYPQEQITQEQYRQWRDSSCTRELKKALTIAFFDLITDDLPDSVDRSIPLMHQREGVKKALEQVFDWIPASLEEVEHEN